ncbi:MAG: rod shape-determining protein MreD [Coriobacteriia bacterium]
MSDRAWTTGLAILGATILQVMLAPHIGILGIVPSIPLLVVITLSLVEGPVAGSVAGFIAGLVLDLLGNGPIGAWALVLTLVGYIAGTLEANVFAEGWLLPVTVALIASIVTELAYLIVLIVLGTDMPFWRSVTTVVLPRGVYEAALALLVYPWLARFLRTDRTMKSFRRLA